MSIWGWDGDHNARASKPPRSRSGGGGKKGCGGKKKMFGALFVALFAVATGAAQVITILQTFGVTG